MVIGKIGKQTRQDHKRCHGEPHGSLRQQETSVILTLSLFKILVLFIMDFFCSNFYFKILFTFVAEFFGTPLTFVPKAYNSLNKCLLF